MYYFLLTSFLVLLHWPLTGQNAELFIPFKNGNRWSVANKSGEILFKTKYDEVYPATENRIRFREKDKYGFIDLKGTVKINPVYQEAADFYDFGREPYSRVRFKDLSFFIDTNGNKANPGAICGGSSINIVDGLTLFQKDGKYGFLEVHGDTVIPPTYKSLKNYNNWGLLVAQDFNLKYGLINSVGDTIHDFNLDSVSYSHGINPFYYIFREGKVGVLSLRGKLLASPKYDKVIPYPIKEEYCFMAVLNGQKMGYVYEGKEFWR